jgi:sulfur carrier protein ThiS
MATILFNAFSFLQKKLKARNRPFVNATLGIAEGTTVEDLIAHMDLLSEDVEAVFVNGSIKPADTVLRDGDRVALVPPGSPGPYRVLLGMMGKKRIRS